MDDDKLFAIMLCAGSAAIFIAGTAYDIGNGTPSIDGAVASFAGGIFSALTAALLLVE